MRAAPTRRWPRPGPLREPGSATAARLRAYSKPLKLALGAALFDGSPERRPRRVRERAARDGARFVDSAGGAQAKDAQRFAFRREGRPRVTFLVLGDQLER